MSVVYKVKANKEIFNRLREVDEDLASIVQNDMTLTEDQVRVWREQYTDKMKYFHQEYMKKVNEFTDAMKEAIIYLENCRTHER